MYFRVLSSEKRLPLIAVDEAHCIVEWLDCTSKYGLCNADLYVCTCDLTMHPGEKTLDIALTKLVGCEL